MVTGLKDIALGMREQVQESSAILDNLRSAMGGVEHLLGNTMRRMKALASFGRTRHIWVLMLFVVGMLFFMWLLFGKKH